jgi:hypothetical protein
MSPELTIALARMRGTELRERRTSRHWLRRVLRAVKRDMQDAEIVPLHVLFDDAAVEAEAGQ